MGMTRLGFSTNQDPQYGARKKVTDRETKHGLEVDGAMGVAYISACRWGATPGGNGGPERVSREIGRKNDLRVGVTTGGEPREGW